MLQQRFIKFIFKGKALLYTKLWLTFALIAPLNIGGFNSAFVLLLFAPEDLEDQTENFSKN